MGSEKGRVASRVYFESGGDDRSGRNPRKKDSLTDAAEETNKTNKL